jgi:putative ABC transport system permease protein
MRLLVAWRGLAHEKVRSVLATLGIFIAVLLIFMELGFFTSVPRGGMVVYDRLEFDIVLAAKTYVFQMQAGAFPRRRINQVRAVGGVASVVPLYQGAGSWLTPEQHLRRRVFVMAFDPDDHVFAVPAIEQQRHLLHMPDAILMDETSRPAFGPAEAGRRVEINGRTVTVAGRYRLGTGFVGLGVAVTSDQSFQRIFPERQHDQVNLGLIKVQAGHAPGKVVDRLRAVLPPDSQAMTRAELTERETSHWMVRTSTGIVWGVGLLLSFVVGAVILFQTLSSQVRRYLPEYAVLKAMGYTNRYLGSIVVLQALILASIAFLPALGLALVLYDVTREATVLPIFMTAERVALVLLAALAMATASAVLALRGLRRADPVELF